MHDYTAEELAKLILAHRAKLARDVVLDVPPTATVIELPRHGAVVAGAPRSGSAV